MRKKKFGSFESLVKTTFVLDQKGSKSKVNRNKSKDIYNYYKEVGHWAKESKNKRADSKKIKEQNNIV
jgi:hypothetical protein